MSRSQRLKLGLLLLLCVNAVLFIGRGEYNDSVDSMAWIVLIILYEIECGRSPWHKQPTVDRTWIRNIAVVVVAVAETSYLFEGAWLDGVYSLLWLLVLGLLESASRYPTAVVSHPLIFRGTGLILVLGMTGVIWAWLLEQAYFNAYDGLLWSLAFLIIDLDLMASALDQNNRRLNNV